jgi:hypothetical protein
MAGPKIPKWVGWPLLGLWTYFVLGYFAKQAVFHPTPYPAGYWEAQESLGAQDVWLDTSDGVRIHGWRIAVDDESALVTLYFHGNAGNISHRIDHITAITAAGSHLLMVDYRGYGKSEGSPSEEGVYRDADAAYRYVREQGYTPEQIVVHGESLGTAVAVDLAAREPCAGVVLEAPFPSASAVARYVLPVLGPLIARGLETGDKIRGVHAPVLIIHGDNDTVIPYELGREVFDAANEPKQLWTLEGAGHNDIVQVAGERYVERLKEFYGKLNGTRIETATASGN